MGLGRIFSGCDSVEDEWGEKIALVCVHACVLSSTLRIACSHGEQR